jgi:hypothetical protein
MANDQDRPGRHDQGRRDEQTGAQNQRGPG